MNTATDPQESPPDLPERLIQPLDDTEALLSAGAWSIDYGHDLGGGVESVRLEYVAEPSTLLLLAAGLALMSPLGTLCKRARQEPEDADRA